MFSNFIIFGALGTIIISLVCIIILLTRHVKILTKTMTFDRVQKTIDQLDKIDGEDDDEYTHPCELLINIVDEAGCGDIIENFISYYLPVRGQEIRTPKLGTITPKRVLIDYSQITLNPKDSGAVFVYVYI